MTREKRKSWPFCWRKSSPKNLTEGRPPSLDSQNSVSDDVHEGDEAGGAPPKRARVAEGALRPFLEVAPVRNGHLCFGGSVNVNDAKKQITTPAWAYMDVVHKIHMAKLCLNPSIKEILEEARRISEERLANGFSDGGGCTCLKPENFTEVTKTSELLRQLDMRFQSLAEERRLASNTYTVNTLYYPNGNIDEEPLNIDKNIYIDKQTMEQLVQLQTLLTDTFEKLKEHEERDLEIIRDRELADLPEEPSVMAATAVPSDVSMTIIENKAVQYQQQQPESMEMAVLTDLTSPTEYDMETSCRCGCAVRTLEDAIQAGIASVEDARGHLLRCLDELARVKELSVERQGGDATVDVDGAAEKEEEEEEKEEGQNDLVEELTAEEPPTENASNFDDNDEIGSCHCSQLEIDIETIAEHPGADEQTATILRMTESEAAPKSTKNQKTESTVVGSSRKKSNGGYVPIGGVKKNRKKDDLADVLRDLSAMPASPVEDFRAKKLKDVRESDGGLAARSSASRGCLGKLGRRTCSPKAKPTPNARTPTESLPSFKRPPRPQKSGSGSVKGKEHSTNISIGVDRSAHQKLLLQEDALSERSVKSISLRETVSLKGAACDNFVGLGDDVASEDASLSICSSCSCGQPVLKSVSAEKEQGLGRQLLEEIGIERLAEAHQAADCCRQSVLNEKPQAELPYPASLASLPLDEKDVQRIRETVERYERNAKTTMTVGRADLRYYADLGKDESWKLNRSPWVLPCYEIRYCETESLLHERLGRFERRKQAKSPFSIANAGVAMDLGDAQALLGALLMPDAKDGDKADEATLSKMAFYTSLGKEDAWRRRRSPWVVSTYEVRYFECDDDHVRPNNSTTGRQLARVIFNKNMPGECRYCNVTVYPSIREPSNQTKNDDYRHYMKMKYFAKVASRETAIKSRLHEILRLPRASISSGAPYLPSTHSLPGLSTFANLATYEPSQGSLPPTTTYEVSRVDTVFTHTPSVDVSERHGRHQQHHWAPEKCSRDQHHCQLEKCSRDTDSLLLTAVALEEDETSLSPQHYATYMSTEKRSNSRGCCAKGCSKGAQTVRIDKCMCSQKTMCSLPPQKYKPPPKPKKSASPKPSKSKVKSKKSQPLSDDSMKPKKKGCLPCLGPKAVPKEKQHSPPPSPTNRKHQALQCKDICKTDSWVSVKSAPSTKSSKSKSSCCSGGGGGSSKTKTKAKTKAKPKPPPKPKPKKKPAKKTKSSGSASSCCSGGSAKKKPSKTKRPPDACTPLQPGEESCIGPPKRSSSTLLTKKSPKRKSVGLSGSSHLISVRKSHKDCQTTKGGSSVRLVESNVNSVNCGDDSCCDTARWAIAKIEILRDGSQQLEILEVSTSPPGHYLVTGKNKVVLMGSQPS